MRPIYSAFTEDALSIKAIEVLQSFGCKTIIIGGGNFAPSRSIAFFTLEEEQQREKEGEIEISWPSKVGRLAAHRLADNLMPLWVCKTPFRVALNRQLNGNFYQSIVDAARRYESWLVGGYEGAPWGQIPQSKIWLDKFVEWRVFADKVLPKGAKWEITPSLHQRSKRSKRRRKREDKAYFTIHNE